MDRQEFLQGLDAALEGEISAGAKQSNLTYYRDYISEEISRGRSEDEVMAELGDPRLIARTIVDAAVAEEESQGYYRTESAGSAQYNYREAAAEQFAYEEAPQSAGRTVYEDVSQNQGRYAYEDSADSVFRGFRAPVFLTGWKATLLIAAVVVCLLLVISLVFHVAFRILFSPVFWILLAVWMIWRGRRGRRGGGFW